MRHHKAKVVVNTFTEALDAVDGKHYTLDGVSGTIKVSHFKERSGHIETKVSHEPDSRGKRSAKYLETKRQLRDDWSTDLTWSESLPTIMHKLGIVFA